MTGPQATSACFVLYGCLTLEALQSKLAGVFRDTEHSAYTLTWATENDVLEDWEVPDSHRHGS